MIEWLNSLTSEQIVQIIGLYLSGLGAMAAAFAAIAAVWIGLRQDRRRILISQSFSERWDEEYILATRDHRSEITITNTGNAPVTVYGIILSMPKKYASVTGGVLIRDVKFPVLIESGHSVMFTFRQTGPDSWPVKEIVKVMKNFPLWRSWLELRLDVYWRVRLVTGEVFKQKPSEGLSLLAWKELKSAKVNRAMS